MASKWVTNDDNFQKARNAVTSGECCLSFADFHLNTSTGDQRPSINNHFLLMPLDRTHSDRIMVTQHAHV